MIGKQISHYRITEKLGEGGMGVVYKADDTKLERTVALKFLPPAATESADDRERFTAEARAAAALHHPNICTIFEIGEEDGRMFISMAYIEGETVRERIDRDGALPPLEVAKIAMQVSEGLSAAHEKGIVHRDIKSANVMVTPRGQAQIMDFGLADRDGQQSESGSSTLGTVAYGSPEQATGEPTDFRTDIWSFGVTLYEMLTGQLPFRGDYQSAITYSVLNENPTPASELTPGLPTEFDDVISRCIAKAPGDRYQSADELGAAIREILHSIDPTITRARGAVAPADSRSWLQRAMQPGALMAIVAYVAFALAAFAAVSVVGPRFAWSPHIKTVLLVGLMSLVPTVALIAARPRGRELLVIPANLIAGLALLAFIFSGKELGATTTTKTVTNEDGETIERVVPNVAFRRRFALYTFENATGSEDNEWLSYATPLLLEYVVYQDPAAEVRGAFSGGAFRDLKRAGFQEWNGVPRSLKAKLAREAGMPYFVEGKVVSAGDNYQIDVELVDSESGRTQYQNTFSGPDIFSLTDEISDRIKSQVGIPEWHTDEIKTMTASQTVTHSVEAMKAFTMGQKAVSLDRDFDKAIEHLEAATQIDSTLAYAWYDLFQVYRMSNRGEEALAAAERCLRHSYKLPERAQFLFKANYYYNRQQPDKALTLSKMAVELYPDDSQGWTILGRIYELRDDKDKALEAYEHLLELDPGDYNLLLRVGGIYEQKADYENARDYYQRYIEHDPTSPRALQQLGALYERMSDYDAARETYDRALIVDPQRVGVAVALANVERTLGRFDEAEQGYRDALAMCQSAEDRVIVYNAMERYYDLRGQYRKSIATQKKRYAEMATYLPPLAVVANQFEGLSRYAWIGQEDTAFERLEALSAQLSPPYDKSRAFGYVGINLTLERPLEAEKWLPMIDEYIASLRLGVIRPYYHLLKGLTHDLKGEHELAIESLEAMAAMQPSEVIAQSAMGRNYRQMAEYEKALEQLKIAEARTPFEPHVNYELALVYHALGKIDEANQHLERALITWADADPEYREARDARELAARWEKARTM